MTPEKGEIQSGWRRRWLEFWLEEVQVPTITTWTQLTFRASPSPYWQAAEQPACAPVTPFSLTSRILLHVRMSFPHLEVYSFFKAEIKHQLLCE